MVNARNRVVTDFENVDGAEAVRGPRGRSAIECECRLSVRPHARRAYRV